MEAALEIIVQSVIFAVIFVGVSEYKERERYRKLKEDLTTEIMAELRKLEQRRGA